jgi:hypothetical protein
MGIDSHVQPQQSTHERAQRFAAPRDLERVLLFRISVGALVQAPEPDVNHHHGQFTPRVSLLARTRMAFDQFTN